MPTTLEKPDPSTPEHSLVEPNEGLIASRSDHGGWPWARVLLGATIAGPALWIGGVFPACTVAFLVVVLFLCIRLCTRTQQSLRIPIAAAIGAFACLVTTLQILPVPEWVRAVVAPGLTHELELALHEAAVVVYPSISPTPADTLLEAARLLGLTLLFVAAAQLSWRIVTTTVAITGTSVALIGLFHAALGSRAIYGMYLPKDVDPSTTPAILTTFVNPNHQASLFLLGIFAALAMARHEHSQTLLTSEPSRIDRHGDRFYAFTAAAVLQMVTLLLSLSRGAIVALIVVTPVAVLVSLRGRTNNFGERRRLRRTRPQRLLAAIGVVALLVLVARHGAWRELATLFTVESFASVTKLRVATDALALIPLAPLLGIGRGAFIDVFGLVDSQPSLILQTHLESAPVAMLVEWGPLAGSLIVLMCVAWWVASWRDAAEGGRARRIALIGPLALAIQNFGDFGFAALGVAAPVCALAGALSPRQVLRLRGTSALRVVAPLVVAAAIGAAVAGPHTWIHRTDRNAMLTSGSAEGEYWLRWRPLDGQLHLTLARNAAMTREWPKVRARAGAATKLRPGSVDAWMLLSVAQAQLGDAESSRQAMARGLAQLRSAPPAGFVQHLLARVPDPNELAVLAPGDPAAWQLLVHAVAEQSPAHANAMARERSLADPDDALAQRVQVRLALSSENAALALHHARLLHAIEPTSPASILLMVDALRAFSPARERDVRDVLEAALRSGNITDVAELGVLEEALLKSLINSDDPGDHTRARELAPVLLSRPGNRHARRVRHELVNSLSTAP